MEESIDFSSALEKVQEMLSDENGQNRIQSILSSLTGGDNSDTASISDGIKDSLSVGNLLQGGSDSFDMDMFLKLQKLMSLMSTNKNNPQTEFLKGLKPFLKAERRSKLDQAVKLINAVHVIKLFKSLNEGSD